MTDKTKFGKTVFVPEHSDIATRALMDIMERPFAALGKRKRFKPIQYKNSRVEIIITSPQPWGIATIYDLDIMLWLASQIIEAKDNREKTSPEIYFTPYDCLKDIGRGTGGKQYNLFMEAIQRLFNTRIITTIREEDQVLIKGKKYSRTITKGFHWIEEFEVNQEESKNGKKVVKGVKVTLPMWFYLGIVKHESILHLAREYFEIQSGLERMLYLIARKHVGSKQTQWDWSMRKLYEKTGSDDRFSNFALQVRKIVKKNNLPEYSLRLEKSDHNKEEKVVFYRRNALSPKNPEWEPKRLNGKLTSGLVERSLAGLSDD